MKRRKTAAILAIQMLLLTGLTGCESTLAAAQEWINDFSDEENLGKTISEDSKWINSDLIGAVNENTNVSEKDDYHTAVNKQWLIDTEVPDSSSQVDCFSEGAEAQDELNLLLMQRDNTAVDTSMMSQEEYEHLQGLTTDLADLLQDWDTRNESGSEPIREYIAEVEKIQSLDELTEYLTRTERAESQVNLLKISTDTPTYSREQYSVVLEPGEQWSLGSRKEYQLANWMTLAVKSCNDEAAEHVLGNLGYSQQEIQDILHQCYRLETRLSVDTIPSCSSDDEKYTQEYVSEDYDLDELEEMAGNYPLREILGSMGLADSALFTLKEADYLKKLGEVYSESNLDELKSYFIIRIVRQFLPYLDEESSQINQNIQKLTTFTSLEDEAQQDDTLTDKERSEKISLAYEEQLFSDVLDELYIVRYLRSEDKEYLVELTDQMIEYYREMLRSEEWLSEETREKAVEKLDAMTLRILYPDELKDYSALCYSTENTLPEAINAISAYRKEEMRSKVNQPIDSGEWILATRTTNAGYSLEDNSINICAGIMAGDCLYQRDDSEEVKLGTIGMIIGHEITHAFDTDGYQYDKDGYRSSWWTKEDEENFQLRASKVAKYFSSLTPLDLTVYSGKKVQSESIADMGGLKCALGLASQMTDFDYDLFFRSFAGLWKSKNSYYVESQLMSDEHPLGFLRTNVTVQQFDEFLETYDVQEGDGMYLAPEDRILVW